MVQYRGHVSRWQIIKTIAGFLFCAFGAGFSLFSVIQGVLTGKVKSLARHSHELVIFEIEPDWFCLNLAVRTLAIIVFAAMMTFYWRKFLTERKYF